MVMGIGAEALREWLGGAVSEEASAVDVARARVLLGGWLGQQEEGAREGGETQGHREES